MYRDRNIHNYKHVACISYRSETQICSICTGPVTVSIVGIINSHFQYEGIVHACIEEFSSWWIPTIDKTQVSLCHGIKVGFGQLGLSPSSKSGCINRIMIYLTAVVVNFV